MKTDPQTLKKVLTAYQSRLIIETLQRSEVRQAYLEWLLSGDPQAFPSDIFTTLLKNAFENLDLQKVEESIFSSYEEEISFITGLGFIPYHNNKCLVSEIKATFGSIPFYTSIITALRKGLGYSNRNSIEQQTIGKRIERLGNEIQSRLRLIQNPSKWEKYTDESKVLQKQLRQIQDELEDVESFLFPSESDIGRLEKKYHTLCHITQTEMQICEKIILEPCFHEEVEVLKKWREQERKEKSDSPLLEKVWLLQTKKLEKVELELRKNFPDRKFIRDTLNELSAFTQNDYRNYTSLQVILKKHNKAVSEIIKYIGENELVQKMQLSPGKWGMALKAEAEHFFIRECPVLLESDTKRYAEQFARWDCIKLLEEIVLSSKSLGSMDKKSSQDFETQEKLCNEKIEKIKANEASIEYQKKEKEKKLKVWRASYLEPLTEQRKVDSASILAPQNLENKIKDYEKTLELSRQEKDLVEEEIKKVKEEKKAYQEKNAAQNLQEHKIKENQNKLLMLEQEFINQPPSKTTEELSMYPVILKWISDSIKENRQKKNLFENLWFHVDILPTYPGKEKLINAYKVWHDQIEKETEDAKNILLTEYKKCTDFYFLNGKGRVHDELSRCIETEIRESKRPARHGIFTFEFDEHSLISLLLKILGYKPEEHHKPIGIGEAEKRLRLDFFTCIHLGLSQELSLSIMSSGGIADCADRLEKYLDSLIGLNKGKKIVDLYRTFKSILDGYGDPVANYERVRQCLNNMEIYKEFISICEIKDEMQDIVIGDSLSQLQKEIEDRLKDPKPIEDKQHSQRISDTYKGMTQKLEKIKNGNRRSLLVQYQAHVSQKMVQAKNERQLLNQLARIIPIEKSQYLEKENETLTQSPSEEKVNDENFWKKLELKDKFYRLSQDTRILYDKIKNKTDWSRESEYLASCLKQLKKLHEKNIEEIDFPLFEKSYKKFLTVCNKRNIEALRQLYELQDGFLSLRNSESKEKKPLLTESPLKIAIDSLTKLLPTDISLEQMLDFSLDKDAMGNFIDACQGLQKYLDKKTSSGEKLWYQISQVLCLSGCNTETESHLMFNVSTKMSVLMGEYGLLRKGKLQSSNKEQKIEIEVGIKNGL